MRPPSVRWTGSVVGTGGQLGNGCAEESSTGELEWRPDRQEAAELLEQQGHPA